MVVGIKTRRNTLVQVDQPNIKSAANQDNAANTGTVDDANRRTSASSVDTLALGNVDSREILETPALRSNTIKKIISYYINYFQKLVSVESHYTKTMRKLLTNPDPLDRGSTGKKLSEKQRRSISAVNDMFLPANQNGIACLNSQVRESQLRKLDGMDEMVSRVKTNILPNLIALQKQVKQYISSYYKNMEKIYNKMRSQNKLVEKNFDTTYKSIQEHKTNRPYIDPYTARLELEKNINLEKDIETEFLKELEAELSKIKIWEAQIVEQIKRNVHEYYTAKTHELSREQMAYDQSYKSVEAFDYENEYNKFRSKLLKDMDCYSTINSSHNIRIQDINAESAGMLSVIAQGPLKMKSGMIPSFSEYYAVLTFCKYLHMYKSSDAYNKKENPIQSFYLPDMDLIHKDNNGVYGLYSPKSPLFKSKKQSFSDPQSPINIMQNLGSIPKTGLKGTASESWHSVIYELLVKERGQNSRASRSSVAHASDNLTHDEDLQNKENAEGHVINMGNAGAMATGTAAGAMAAGTTGSAVAIGATTNNMAAGNETNISTVDTRNLDITHDTVHMNEGMISKSTIHDSMTSNVPDIPKDSAANIGLNHNAAAVPPPPPPMNNMNMRSEQVNKAIDDQTQTMMNIGQFNAESSKISLDQSRDLNTKDISEKVTIMLDNTLKEPEPAISSTIANNILQSDLPESQLSTDQMDPESALSKKQKKKKKSKK
ncbi:hypothetical protein AYI68_g5632 [Smittium mucronatum]|uniref:SLM1/RGC1-like PH domain-containing protein n=1 Tax=Smittium mucronatum TaxID=133383 RepID=A0A1R0GTS1_9FUNG|nr:hypothetical protein AYI68_g5632 [Smittium mucronatum]